MAELTEQQESPVGEYKRPPQPRGGFWFGVSILLLVVSLAGAGFFLLTQLRTKQEGLNGEVRSEMIKQLGGYQTQLSAIENQIAALQSEITNKSAHIDRTVSDLSHSHDEKLNNTRKELNEAIVRLQRQLGKTRGDWLMADAEYLLSVANERLYLIGDVNTTRQALEAADQRLRESGDASAFKVREQVIKDIAALAKVKPIDVVGLYSAIQVLQSNIKSLVLLLPYAGKTPEISTQNNTNTESQGLLDSAKNKLNEIVTIKHSDHPVKEILTPEEAEFIREQMRIKLEMVKVALVQQNEALYKISLLDAKNWLEQQFRQNNASETFAAELKRFEAIQIRSQFPDISISLKVLRDITKLRVETDKAIVVTPTDSITEPSSIQAPTASSPTPTPVQPMEQDMANPVASPNNEVSKPTDIQNPVIEPKVIEQPALIPAPDSAPATEEMSTPQSVVEPTSTTQPPVNETKPTTREPKATETEEPVAPSSSSEPQAQNESVTTKIFDQLKQLKQRYLPTPGNH